MRNSKSSHRGFTMVELLVVITIIVIIAALLVPTITRMRDRAAATGCSANMRQCIVMGNMFAAEQNGRLPRLHSNKLHGQ